MRDFRTINFLTCGHVDDGKSTLIGRLLHDLNVIPDDQLAAATAADGKLDYALFTDGLADERRQGITIDVAHRYFRYQNCRYRIADTPGHLEYMRNMAVAAVESDIAVILVDAIHGVRLQTVEYSKIARFFGVRRFLIAVNKMDAVGFDEQRYQGVRDAYLQAFRDGEEDCRLQFVPVSALQGDNIVAKSSNMPWYRGATILEYLQKTERCHSNRDLRLPIQHMVRDASGARWYMGTLHGGELQTGDRLVLAETGEQITVVDIIHSGKRVATAQRRQAVAITVAEHIDLPRGAVLSRADTPTAVGDAFLADLLWLGKGMQTDKPFQGRIKIYHRETAAQVAVEGENGLLKAVRVSLSTPIALDNFRDNPRTGLFLLTDSYTHQVVGVGTVKRILSSQ